MSTTKTGIEWTDATWNPIRGCSMASGSEAGGCLNCYAARLNARSLPNLVSPSTGEPFARILESGPRWTGKVELIESALSFPLKLKRPRKIFVNSMSDLFHESLPDESRDRVFAIMSQCPQHTFQILTKRPEIMLKYITTAGREAIVDASGLPEWCHANSDGRWPLPNVWLGVSVEDQKTADARIPLLLQTSAAKRFISYEPALGPVNFQRISDGPPTSGCWIETLTGNWCCYSEIGGLIRKKGTRHRLDWIIAGGESGPCARPMHPDWMRSVRDQCAATDTPFFFKQWGEYLGANQEGAKESEPQELNRSNEPVRVGKKAAGALLDGREHKEFPRGRL